MKVTGLLKSGEIYNKYWCDQHAGTTCLLPRTNDLPYNIRLVFPHRSDEASHWYQYMTTCTIFNSWYTAAHALNGMDKDGDLVMLTDNKVLVDNLKVLPALYVRPTKSKEEKIVTEADAIQANIDSFGDDIGKTTNWITSMFDVQAQFQKGSKEYEERLSHKVRTAFQQNAIDKAKGIIAKPMPRGGTTDIAPIQSKTRNGADSISVSSQTRSHTSCVLSTLL